MFVYRYETDMGVKHCFGYQIYFDIIHIFAPSKEMSR